MKTSKYILLLFIGISLFMQIKPAFSQVDYTKMSKEQVLQMTYDELLALPLGDLMALADIVGVSADELLEMILNIEVSTASKKKESVFNSPLSTTVIPAEMIEQSGATTLEEVLRLVPGMIVRQKTNGNFDVHIRGFDNVPPENFTHFSENMISLVMVDGIPVYNNVSGGTFWETIPVSMAQIDRVEVVRGPSSALYGPNAASGVINIITKGASDKKINLVADAKSGNETNGITNLYVARKITDKFTVSLAGKYDKRNRFTDEYYSFVKGDYMKVEDSLIGLTGVDYYNGINEQSLDQKVARDLWATNLNLLYQQAPDIKFSLTGTMQDSKIQTAFFENLATPYSTRTSTTNSVNFKADVKGLSANVSYQFGRQNLSEGMIRPVIEYDMSNLMANLEYEIVIKDKLSIRPGFNYQQCAYDDSEYEKEYRLEKNDPGINGLFHGKKESSLMAGSLKLDYAPTEALRFIAALRADKYEYIDNTKPAYQLVASYKINENHMVRANYSQANRGAFVGNVHANFKNQILINEIVGVIPDADYAMFKAYLSSNSATASLVDLLPAVVPVRANYNQYYIGSDINKKDYELTTLNTAELGYRGKLAKNLQIDVEAFHTIAKDFDALVPTGKNMDTVFYTLGELTGISSLTDEVPLPKLINIEDTLNFENIKIKGTQIGVSATVDYVASKKLTFRFFGTWQQTRLKDHITIEGEKKDIDHKNTPTFYGGFNILYSPVKEFYMNVGSYFYTEQTYNHYWLISQNADANAIQKKNAQDIIGSKMIVNAKFSYMFEHQNTVYVQFANLLFDDKREFAFTDPIKTTFLLGITFRL